MTDAICPFVLSPDGKRVRCVGSRCALWKWSKEERSAAFDERFLEAMAEFGVTPRGKTKPQPLQVSQAKIKAREAMKGWTGTEGHCGLIRE